VTTTPENPFAAAAVGVLYRRGRPYHHPRTLARVRALVGGATGSGAGAGADVDVDVGCALDVACGTGMSTTALADIVRANFGGVVVGLDISPEMMRVAPPAANVTYMLGNAERLPFATGVFDAVTCCSGVHWFDQARFYAELRRVLRPDGWVALYDHYFVGMDGEFRDWTRALIDRYPLPPRNPQVGDPRTETPEGFELLGSDVFADPIELSHEQFVDYQLTVSYCVAAVERGTPRPEIREWLLASTAQFFVPHATRVLEFMGTSTCLRRLP
jgi:SAM-dependent methyltransferase